MATLEELESCIDTAVAAFVAGGGELRPGRLRHPDGSRCVIGCLLETKDSDSVWAISDALCRRGIVLGGKFVLAIRDIEDGFDNACRYTKENIPQRTGPYYGIGIRIAEKYGVAGKFVK